MRPLIPVSISSKISVSIWSRSARIAFRASIILESSPPDTICPSGFLLSPGFVEIFIFHSIITIICIIFSAVKTDTDWFDEALTSHKSAAGLIIGDNGMELLILTEHEKVKDGDLKVRFYDHTEAAGTLKKYDSNTGLAVVSCEFE